MQAARVLELEDAADQADDPVHSVPRAQESHRLQGEAMEFIEHLGDDQGHAQSRRLLKK